MHAESKCRCRLLPADFFALSAAHLLPRHLPPPHDARANDRQTLPAGGLPKSRNAFSSKDVRLAASGIRGRMIAVQSGVMGSEKICQHREIAFRAIPIRNLCGARTAH